MEDVRNGVPEAMRHLERVYGVTVSKPGKPETKPEKETPAETTPDEDFLDEVAGKKISQLEKKYNDLAEKYNAVHQHYEKLQERAAGEAAEAALIDDMVTVAERVPALKSINNLRGAIRSWRGGKADDLVVLVLSEVKVEVVKVAACRAENQHALSFHPVLRDQRFLPPPNWTEIVLNSPGLINSGSFDICAEVGYPCSWPRGWRNWQTRRV